MGKHDKQKERRVEETAGLTRRGFARLAFGGVGLCYGAVVGYPVYRYLKSPVQKAQAAAAVTEVMLKDAQKLPEGRALVFMFGVEPCLLIHHRGGKWVALSAKYTHLGCTVQYEPAPNRISCACHGGTYDPETGRNLSGPPPKPLRALVVKEVTGEGVRVTRV